jgi:hypothetical protein
MKQLKLVRITLVLIGLAAALWVSQPAQAQNLLADPGFEAGTPNPSWFEASINFGTPLCTVASCGTGTGTGPFTGDWWAWFGGIGAYEAGEVNQSVVIPPGNAILKFWFENHVSSGNGIDYLTIEIDGNAILTIYESSGYDPYSPFEIDVSAYADGNSHNIRFFSEIFGPTTTNFFVDDVELIHTPGEIPLKGWSIALAIGLIAAVAIFRFRRIYS